MSGDKKVNWNDIPDSTLLPAGKILLQITEIEEVISVGGKLMYKHKLTAIEPAECAGMVHFENFVIGSDDDPLADSPMTWKSSIGAKRMKNMYTKARVPFSESMYATMAAARGAMFVGKTVVKKDNDPNSKYFGNEQTNITTCYMVGEAVPALDTGGGASAGVGSVSSGPAPAPAAPMPMPTSAPAPMPTMAPAPLAPVAPTTPPPAPVKQMTTKAQGTYEQYTAAGWSDAQLIEHGFMEMVNPTPAPVVAPTPAAPPAPAMSAVPATPQAPAPAMAAPVLTPNVGAPTAPTAAAPPTTPTPATTAPVGEATTNCPMCQHPIPNSQFASHVAMCAANRAAQAASGLK